MVEWKEIEGEVKESQGEAGKDTRDTRHPSSPPLHVSNKSWVEIGLTQIQMIVHPDLNSSSATLMGLWLWPSWDTNGHWGPAISLPTAEENAESQMGERRWE